MAETIKMLNRVAAEKEAGKQVPRKVFRPAPGVSRISVSKEGDTFVVVVPGLERIVAGEGVTGAEMRGLFKRQLGRLGVSKTLEKAGIKPGDKVRCGTLEWEW
jgi:Obg family GTPase CgtA-like protein